MGKEYRLWSCEQFVELNQKHRDDDRAGSPALLKSRGNLGSWSLTEHSAATQSVLSEYLLTGSLTRAQERWPSVTRIQLTVGSWDPSILREGRKELVSHKFETISFTEKAEDIIQQSTSETVAWEMAVKLN